MRFVTENSIYEVDEERSRVRRVEGMYVPTPYQGEDGEWKTYTDITDIEPGKRVLISWDVGQATLTSIVCAVQVGVDA